MIVKFINELGNTIDMEVSIWPQRENVVCDSVHVRCSGPNSHIDHLWTRMEAEMLRDLFCEILGLPELKEQEAESDG